MFFFHAFLVQFKNIASKCLLDYKLKIYLVRNNNNVTWFVYFGVNI